MVAVKKNDLVKAEASLREARELASDNLAAVEQVVRLAMALKLTRVALEFSAPLLDDPRTGTHTALALLKLAQKRDDYEIERTVFRHLSSELGPHAVEQMAYIELLDNGNIAKAKQALAKLTENQSATPGLVAIKSLAALRAGSPSEALSVLETSGIDWAREDSRWQLVQAQALQAGGAPSAARSVAIKINPASLRAPERELLHRILNP
jgi:hypothetical protein